MVSNYADKDFIDVQWTKNRKPKKLSPGQNQYYRLDNMSYRHSGTLLLSLQRSQPLLSVSTHTLTLQRTLPHLLQSRHERNSKQAVLRLNRVLFPSPDPHPKWNVRHNGVSYSGQPYSSPVLQHIEKSQRWEVQSGY